VAAATATTPNHADPVGAVDIGDRKEMADLGPLRVGKRTRIREFPVLELKLNAQALSFAGVDAEFKYTNSWS
jgi:hypothetical protein